MPQPARSAIRSGPHLFASPSQAGECPDLIVSQLAESQIPLELQITPFGNLVDSLDSLLREGFDLVFASQQTVQALVQLKPAGFDTASEVVL